MTLAIVIRTYLSKGGQQFLPSHLPKREDSICSARCVHDKDKMGKNVHSSFIHNCPKWKLPVVEWIYKLWYVHKWTIIE